MSVLRVGGVDHTARSRNIRGTYGWGKMGACLNSAVSSLYVIIIYAFSSHE
jgi:hypothetical protein